MFVVGVASATLGILPEWYSFVWSALSGAPAGPLPSGEHAIHAGWFQAVGWPLMVVSVAWRQMQD
jgi:hypothetical protein